MGMFAYNPCNSVFNQDNRTASDLPSPHSVATHCFLLTPTFTQP